MRTASIGGRSENRMPGGRWRRGPANETGETRSDQTGSVRMFKPSVWMRTVEWLMKVTRVFPAFTRSGGRGPGGVLVKGSHGPRSRFVIQRRKSEKLWWIGSIERKRFPSKCGPAGPRQRGAENAQPAATRANPAAPVRPAAIRRERRDMAAVAACEEGDLFRSACAD